MSSIAANRPSRFVATIAALGVAWNLFGVYQWWGRFNASPDMLMGKGITPEQAALYSALPSWMTMVFAVGVFGELAGSLLLLEGRRVAVPVLWRRWPGIWCCTRATSRSVFLLRSARPKWWC